MIAQRGIVFLEFFTLIKADVRYLSGRSPIRSAMPFAAAPTGVFLFLLVNGCSASAPQSPNAAKTTELDTANALQVSRAQLKAILLHKSSLSF